MDKLPPPPPPPPPGHGRSPGQRPERSDRDQRPDPNGDDDGRQTPTWVKRWLPWIAVGLFLVLVLVPTLTSGNNGDEITYSDFIVRVEAGDVDSIEWENESGKITGELGWRPSESFETGLRKTVRWYLDHAAWVADVTSGAYRDWVGKHYAAESRS